MAAKLRTELVQTSKKRTGIVMAVKLFRDHLPFNILNYYSPHPLDYNGKRTGGMADRIFGVIFHGIKLKNIGFFNFFSNLIFVIKKITKNRHQIKIINHNLTFKG